MHREWLLRLKMEEPPELVMTAKAVMQKAVQTATEAKLLSTLLDERISAKAKRPKLEATFAIKSNSICLSSSFDSLPGHKVRED